MMYKSLIAFLVIIVIMSGCNRLDVMDTTAVDETEIVHYMPLSQRIYYDMPTGVRVGESIGVDEYSYGKQLFLLTGYSQSSTLSLLVKVIEEEWTGPVNVLVQIEGEELNLPKSWSLLDTSWTEILEIGPEPTVYMFDEGELIYRQSPFIPPLWLDLRSALSGDVTGHITPPLVGEPLPEQVFNLLKEVEGLSFDEPLVIVFFNTSCFLREDAAEWMRN